MKFGPHIHNSLFPSLLFLLHPHRKLLTGDYAPKAVFWVLCSCLILGFFGMMMITFRSSMKMSVVDNSYAGHFLHTESLSLRHHNKETFDETDIREMDSSSDAVQSPKHPQQPQEENFEDERKEQGTSTVTSNNAS